MGYKRPDKNAQMPTSRRTRATSVAATKEAEPPSRRTRAASVSANKRPEVVKKAAATPKRKRSASAAPRAASKARDAERAPKRRESGRAKRARTDAGEDDGRRGRRAEREEEEDQADVDNDTLSPWSLAELQAAVATRDERFSIFQKNVGTASVEGLSAAKKRELGKTFEELMEDERKLQIRSQDWPDHQKGDSCCLVHEGEKRKAKLLKWGKKLADARSWNESDQATTMTQEEKFQRHQEEKKELVKTARLALAGQMSEGFKAELIRMHESIAQAEKDFKRTKNIGDELTEIGWRLKAEKTVEQLAKEKPPKKDPKSRVKGAYFDTTAQGYEKAPLPARQHRTQQKLIAEEKEKAGRVFEDLKEEFVKGLEFRADGTTNIGQVEGQRDFRYQLWILEEELKDLEKEREDLEKIKSFISKVGDVTLTLKAEKDGVLAAARQIGMAEKTEKARKELENMRVEFDDSIKFYESKGTNKAMMKAFREFRSELGTLEEEYKEFKEEKGGSLKFATFSKNVYMLLEKFKHAEHGSKNKITDDVRKKLEKGKEVGLVDQYTAADGTLVEKEGDYTLNDDGEIFAVFPDDGLEKIADAPSTAKKTPRRKSIRMGALSIFTPNGTRANSEAMEDIPSSPLSPPPHIQEAPVVDQRNPALRAPETISWATPVSEIHNFLAERVALHRSYPDPKSFSFDTRPIGFKCPGHKREWRGAEQTKDLIIYREWLNDSSNIGRDEFYGFFMTPRDISKPPTLVNMKSLKDWKAWGAGVVTKNKNRTLVICDPEFSAEEVMRMKKTGELTKMQQLLIGAVKRCRGSCDEVMLAGRTTEDEEREKETAVEKDSFARMAEWAARVISDGQMNVSRSIKKLEIAK